MCKENKLLNIVNSGVEKLEKRDQLNVKGGWEPYDGCPPPTK